jgi:hypothetical protein
MSVVYDVLLIRLVSTEIEVTVAGTVLTVLITVDGMQLRQEPGMIMTNTVLERLHPYAVRKWNKTGKFSRNLTQVDASDYLKFERYKQQHIGAHQMVQK